MFKDELNIAFENVKPSPELLDRVSAMMSEEVKRKKPPLRMNVVKYAGIAAALVLAAGGTLLVLNNMNNGVKTSGATESAMPGIAAVTTTAPVMAEAEAAAADEAPEAGMAVQNYSGAAAAETTTTSAAATIAANNDDLLKIAAGAANDTETDGFEIFPAQTTAAMAMPTAEENFADEMEIAADEAPMLPDAVPTADEICDDGTADVIAKSIDGAAPIAIDATSGADAEKVERNYEEPIVPQEASDDNFTADAEEEALEECLDTADYVAAADDSCDAAKPVYLDDPQKAFIHIEIIPDPLWNSVDSAEANAWYESFPIDLASGEVPDSLESYPNVYTFIKHFGVSEEQLKELIGYMLNDEQIDILYHGTVAEITAEFASPLSIVKGEKIYSWYWVTTHTAEDYAAAGITNDDLIAHGYIVE